MRKYLIVILILVLLLFILGCEEGVSKTGLAGATPGASVSCTCTGDGDCLSDYYDCNGHELVYYNYYCNCDCHLDTSDRTDCYVAPDCSGGDIYYSTCDVFTESCVSSIYESCAGYGCDDFTDTCLPPPPPPPPPTPTPTPTTTPTPPPTATPGTATPPPTVPPASPTPPLPLCCKCFWLDSTVEIAGYVFRDKQSVCAEKRCQKWFNKIFGTCDIHDIVSVDDWDEINSDTVGYSDERCPAGYNAVYQFEGHSSAENFDNFAKFCIEENNCPFVKGDITGCSTFNNLEDAKKRFESYKGPNDVTLTANQWVCYEDADTGETKEWSMTPVTMKKEGVCYSYEYPLCDDIDNMVFCSVNGERPAACSNDPADPTTIDEYRKCCCADTVLSWVLSTKEVGFSRGAPVWAADDQEECDSGCTEYEDGSFSDYFTFIEFQLGAHIFLSGVDNCDAVFDDCTSWSGSDYIRHYTCDPDGPYPKTNDDTGVEYSYTLERCPDANPICYIDKILQKSPECIPANDDRLNQRPPTTVQFRIVLQSTSTAEFIDNINSWLTT